MPVPSNDANPVAEANDPLQVDHDAVEARSGLAGGTQQFIEALHALEESSDVERMVRLFDDTAEISNPMDTSPHLGQDGARRFWRTYRDSFEQIHSDFSRIVESDGAAMLEWTSHGVLRGDRPIDYSGVSVLELQNGKVHRFRTYFDARPFEVGSKAD